MKLEESNPRLARRSCDDCKKWWYNEKTGLITVAGFGVKQERVGPTPCETELGCAKGTPDKQNVLNTANKWAYTHYKHCAATDCFPDDPIVRQNASIIEDALKSVRKAASKGAVA